jgi:hypothetical protein
MFTFESNFLINFKISNSIKTRMVPIEREKIIYQVNLNKKEKINSTIKKIETKT